MDLFTITCCCQNLLIGVSENKLRWLSHYQRASHFNKAMCDYLRLCSLQYKESSIGKLQSIKECSLCRCLIQSCREWHFFCFPFASYVFVLVHVVLYHKVMSKWCTRQCTKEQWRRIFGDKKMEKWFLFALDRDILGEENSQWKPQVTLSNQTAMVCLVRVEKNILSYQIKL